MSKLTEQFRNVGIYNAWEFYGVGRVYIDRQTTFGRSPIPSAWKVIRPGYKTDPEGWHYDGHKAFSYAERDGSKQAFEEAKAWASERYGVREWKRDPFGAYGEAQFVVARIAELKQVAADAKGSSDD